MSDSLYQKMILISHRGNLIGPIPERENSQEYIQEALDKGFDVEIDVWVNNNQIYLGHNTPQYAIDKIWLYLHKKNLWIHCKNIEAINYFTSELKLFNYFWHENDTITLTSRNNIWVYPGKQPIKNSIAVMPEIYNDDVSQCMGICSDYIQNYKK
jgi:hypothetical protein